MADWRASSGSGSETCGYAWDAQYVGGPMRHGAIPATNALKSAKYKAVRNNNGLGRAIAEVRIVAAHSYHAATSRCLNCTTHVLISSSSTSCVGVSFSPPKNGRIERWVPAGLPRLLFPLSTTNASVGIRANLRTQLRQILICDTYQSEEMCLIGVGLLQGDRKSVV